ncbi:aldo/keto reductase [Methanobacterium aggregans]|uniref:aldo/keto reductase n=1 Tax=Methanobacterium aggregans TaxID=1615586 RepID=UPI00320F7A90
MTLLYREFGKTGEKVSVLGFGCMRLPTIGGRPENIDKTLAGKMLTYAIENGVNYVDTAYPYHAASPKVGGASETFLGEFLSEGLRDEVKLATKLPIWLVEEKGDMDRILDDQLKKLQTDRIDFYLLHGLHRRFWPMLQEYDVFEFLDSAVEDGRIGYPGFSFHDELDFFIEAVDSYKWSFCQIQYNYMDQNFQAGRKGLEYAAKRGLGTAIMEPLRGGCLTRNIPEDIQTIWDRVETKRSLAEWALRFLWDQEDVNLVISGMNSMEDVVENVEIAERGIPNSLTEDERNLIDDVQEAYISRVHVGCTGCNYCMPCQEGVNIPLNLSLLDDVYIYENLDKPSGNYFHLMGRKMSAGYCTECGVCEENCTQNLPIRKYLKETRETFEKSSKSEF